MSLRVRAGLDRPALYRRLASYVLEPGSGTSAPPGMHRYAPRGDGIRMVFADPTGVWLSLVHRPLLEPDTQGQIIRMGDWTPDPWEESPVLSDAQVGLLFGDQAARVVAVRILRPEIDEYDSPEFYFRKGRDFLFA